MRAPVRWRRWAFRLISLLAAVVVALSLAEGAVRLFPGVLPDTLRHAAFSRYDTLPGGIFRYEGVTRSRIMRAGYRIRAFSHGYSWTHETDELGYRNPTGLTDRDILLLGDSIIYGHGVEGEETVTQVLRTEHGVHAYDMSAQGQCLYQHYLALRLHLERIRPQVVLLFVFVNDPHDLEALGRLAYRPQYPELGRFDYDSIRRRIERLNAFREPMPVRLAFSSALVRTLAKQRGWRPARPPESVTPKRWRPPHRSASTHRAGTFAAVLDRSRFAPIESYYELVLADLAARTNRLGTRLVVIHLQLPAEESRPARERAQETLDSSLQTICGSVGIELVDTRDFFDGHNEWILPGDGHLNPAGHQALAGFVADTVLSRN